LKEIEHNAALILLFQVGLMKQSGCINNPLFQPDNRRIGLQSTLILLLQSMLFS